MANRAAAESAKAKSKEFAVKLWEEGICDFEKISKLTDLPIDEVKELFKDKSA